MDVHSRILICSIYTICLIGLTCTDTPCNPHDTPLRYKCTSNETCQVTDVNATSGVCKCKPGLQRKAPDGPCLADPSSGAPRSSDSSDMPVSTKLPRTSSYSVSTVAAGVLVPLVVLGAVGLVLAARRYQWAQKLHRLRVRRYDEVRIGEDDDDDDDDPPLA